MTRLPKTGHTPAMKGIQALPRPVRLLLIAALVVTAPRFARAQGYYPLPGQPVANVGLPPPPNLGGQPPPTTAGPQQIAPQAGPQYQPAPQYSPAYQAPSTAAPQQSPAGPAVPQAAAAVAPGAPVAPAAPARDLFELGQIVAIVGNQYILYGDVAPTVNQYIAGALARAKSREELEQIEAAREPLTRQVIKQLVEAKLMYLEFEREMEKKAGKDKLAEARQDIHKRVGENFDKELLNMQQKVLDATPEELQGFARKDPFIPKLAVMMKDNNLLTPGELDRYLRRHGSSLEKQRRAWGEYHIGRSAMGGKLEMNPEVSHIEMLDYFHKYSEKYQLQAKARFEILSVRFDRFPSREAAWQAIAAMGNEVFFGAPFAAVAKKSSHDPNAAKGGVYDWTNQGSLASEAIDAAVFSLEIGKLSQIIEDERGLHIVRVLERQPAGQVPFTEAQKEIKEAIANEKKDEQIKEFLQSLRENTPVWTIYDNASGGIADQRAKSNLAPR